MIKHFLSGIWRGLWCAVLLCSTLTLFAQQKIDTLSRPIPADSLHKIAQPVKNKKAVDSVLHVHTPRKAIIRSAIIPGWGQIYNKKYWKLPIVYGALGASGSIFYYNLNSYRDTRFAYKARYNARVNNDTTNLAKIKPELKPLSEESLRFYRDEFRRNVDYSALFFIALWGLNIVDAAVDAHLKSFDVSPDLGLRFKAGYSDMAGMNGVSIILAFK